MRTPLSPAVRRQATLSGAVLPGWRRDAEIAETALRAAGSPRPQEGGRVFVALLDGLGLHRIATGADQDVERALLTLFIPSRWTRPRSERGGSG